MFSSDYEFKRIANAEADDTGIIERPVLPIRSTVIYPKLVTPISISDPHALAAARVAMDTQRTVIAATLRDSSIQHPTADDLYLTGTEVAIGRMIPLPDNHHSALVEGRRRVEILAFKEHDGILIAKARLVQERGGDLEELLTLEQTLMNLFEQTIELNDSLPQEVLDYTFNMHDPSWLADFITTTLTIPIEDRQRVLEMADLRERLRFVAKLLGRELNMLEIRDEINGQIQQEMARNQREIYLREQMRIIQGELGEADLFGQELDDLRQQIDKAGMTAEAYDKAIKELNRLQMMPPMSPEVGIIRTYLDWLVALPWEHASEDNLDLARAQKILDEEHHGLQKVKDRILEHIAVRKLAPDKMKTPILCFVGPPGVGKTSMGKSIAKALGREFVRVSLGGVRDEAEIRGHRRTYIGALPGRIIQTMRRAGTVNPVFMLDEIDKLGVDFRGDPSAALLEALDPEQNTAFSDHYLDVSYDLSQVFFITTANDLYPLEAALLDRLEIIEFPGYTEEDKLQIARKFLIPQQLEAHGIEQSGIRLETPALQTIIREYTYEAGVRNLNREIGSICRKVARLYAENKPYPKRIQPKHINTFLGPPQFLEMRVNDQDAVGLATGLAWTPNGGDILTIEISILPGKGTLTLTGQLGDVMQESAQTALSYMRSRAIDLDVPSDDFENYDVHIHMPEGAIPKDGPSAGITLATAIISAFTERKVRADWAMTGEITLRGRVLPVGGIKEKLLAAHRNRIMNVILPEHNRKDLIDIPAKALKQMNLVFVEDMQQVMDIVLLDPPPGGRQRDQYRSEED